jgi:hypothetical protein
MSVVQFDRDSMARWYADRHLKTDPGILEIHYLPANAPDREVRLLEVNSLIATRTEDPIQPIDFGVDIGAASGHTLLVADVTPEQWSRIKQGRLELPDGWSLKESKAFRRTSHE